MLQNTIFQRLPMTRITKINHLQPLRRYVQVSTTSTPTTNPGNPKSIPSVKRFWKKVTVQPITNNNNNNNNEDAKYAITLDTRSLRTPSSKTPLHFPSSQKLLADLVGAEWEAQGKTLKGMALPLTSIVMRAYDSVDGLANPEIKEGVVEKVCGYIDTDAVCYWQPYPESFVDLQEQHWRPIIQWASNHYNIDISLTNGILSIEQPSSTKKVLNDAIASLNSLHLSALEKSVYMTKSVLISLALLNGKINVEQAIEASRLEVMHQIEKWGEVEDAHDVDLEDTRRVLGSVGVVLAL